MVNKFLMCQQHLTYKSVVLDNCTKKQRQLLKRVDFIAKGGMILGGLIFYAYFILYEQWIGLIGYFFFVLIYPLCLIQINNKIRNYINYFVLSRHHRNVVIKRPIRGVKIRVENYKLVRKIILIEKCKSKKTSHKVFLNDLCIIVKPRIIELTTLKYNVIFTSVAISGIVSIICALIFPLLIENKDKMIGGGLIIAILLYLGFVGDYFLLNRQTKFLRKYKELLETINDIIDG